VFFVAEGDLVSEDEAVAEHDGEVVECAFLSRVMILGRAVMSVLRENLDHG
jgi:hypothetical protein